VIVYIDKVEGAPKRCRFCTGRPAESGEKPGDPICTRWNKGGSCHDWLRMENPLTNYLRLITENFWAAEGQGDPSRLTSPEFSRAKKRLELRFQNLEPSTLGLFGTSFRAQFELPTRNQD
jgi:hypothetical protein